MMQPLESCEEQEIIFDEDDESDGVSTGRSAVAPEPKSSHPLVDFQPLAEDTVAAQSAACHLESFLSSSEDTTVSHTASLRDTPHYPRTPSGIATTIHSPSYLSSRDVASQLENTDSHSGNLSTTINTDFDPYASPHRHITHASLLDNSDDEDTVATAATRIVPGSAGFLEMEEEPPRTPLVSSAAVDPQLQRSPAAVTYDPIQTSSGLLLTHRRVPTAPILSGQQQRSIRSQLELETGTTSMNTRHTGMGFDNGHHYPTLPSYAYPPRLPRTLPQLRSFSSFPTQPLLRYVRLGVVLSALILFAGTAVLLHHALSGSKNASMLDKDQQQQQQRQPSGNQALDERDRLQFDADVELIPLSEDGDFPDRIILLPLPEYGIPGNQKHRRLEPLRSIQNDPNRLVGVQAFPHENEPPTRQVQQAENRLVGVQAFPHENEPPTRQVQQAEHAFLLPLEQPLAALKAEFQAWKKRHNKTYHSEQEHHRRFTIWSENHHKTAAKNERHGPCKMTGKSVFGSNHFQDLTEAEFKSQYLNGYNLKREPSIKRAKPKHQPVVLDPRVIVPNRHPDVHRRILQHQEQSPLYALNYQAGCKWYDVSCHLRYIFSKFLYGMGGTMEPRYDADSYPTGTCAWPCVVWPMLRTLGVLTFVCVSY
jgi:Cathepsin propeptide inhibitor domain (I29)